jgi:DNA repair protein RadB
MSKNFEKRTIPDEIRDYKVTGSGSDAIDGLLCGGFENKTLTTIFGPAGSGKTNIVLLASREILKKGKKVIFIDTENSFSVERFRQIGGLCDDFYDKMIILRPMDFSEQKEIITHLKDIVDKDVGLVVVDSIAMLYRLEMGKQQDVYLLNREFSIQVSHLIDIAIRNNIPLLVTNQVYADFEQKDKVNMVGGDLLRYSSKCLIELKSGHRGLRQATVKKHRSIDEGKTVYFTIVNDGILRQDE